MDAPTTCVCGRVVDLHDMWPIRGILPDGGNLVCEICLCRNCCGTGCLDCSGNGYICNDDRRNMEE